jgi:hypothetical protein
VLAHANLSIFTPDLFDLADIPALSSFPGMASSIPTTTTMSSLVSGGPSSQRQIPVTKGRRNSLSRNDLSMTMDRMALGGRTDPEGGYYPLEYGRMRAACWMECLLTHQIPEEEYVPSLSRCSHVNRLLGSVPVIGVRLQVEDFPTFVANGHLKVRNTETKVTRSRDDLRNCLEPRT